MVALETFRKYKEESGVNVDYETFMNPKRLVEFHSKHVGTVVKRYVENLSIYPHIYHFGCMFIFIRLNKQLLTNGPTVSKRFEGSVCAI